MSDLLMEADEALRQEKIMTFWKDNASMILTFVFFTVLATAVMSAYRAWDKKVKESGTAAAFFILDDSAFPDNVADQELNMRDDLAALVQLTAAGEYINLDEPDTAHTTYQNILDNYSPSQELEQLALLMKERTNTDSSKFIPESRATAALLEQEDSPWHSLALIDIAVEYATSEQNYSKAREYLNTVLNIKALPPTLYERAQALDNIYAVKEQREAP